MTEGVLTARQELEEIAELLREADQTEKEAKAQKEQARGPFFELISEVVREEVPLARKTVTVDLDADFDVEVWRSFNYPEWRVVAFTPEADEEGPATRAKITVEENEDFKKFEFVVNGFKFGRTIRMEGKEFKAESFQGAVKADTTLDKKVKTLLNKVVTKKLVPVFEVDEDKAVAIMAEYPETVALFQQFMFPGTPKPALLPIKKAKDADLA